MITDYYIGPDWEVFTRPHFWGMWSLFQDDGFGNYAVRSKAAQVFVIEFIREGVPD